MIIESDEIKKILPHRYPFLLIDRVIDVEPGVSATARKCVTANEPFFQGHFPVKQVMPGVLIIEALAQTGAVAILMEEENKGKIALFAGINKARFKRQIIPGDVMELTCEIGNRRGSVGYGSAKAFVIEEDEDGHIVKKLAVSAELIFAIDESSKDSAE